MRRSRQMVASMAISALLHAVALMALGAWLLDRDAHRDDRLIRVSLPGPGDDAESHRLPGEIPGLPVAVPGTPAGPAVKRPEAAPKQRLHSSGGARSTRTRRSAAISAPVEATAPFEATPPSVEHPERAEAQSAARSEPDDHLPPPDEAPDDRGAPSAPALAGEVEPAGDALPRSKDEPGPEEEGLAGAHAPEPMTTSEEERLEPVAMAQPPAAPEGAEEPPDPSSDDRVVAARRALASANELMDLAESEGDEAEAHLADAAAALAGAEEKLRDLEATAIEATPQTGAPAALPLGGGAGSPGAPHLSGDGQIDALAQERVNYVISLIGPSAARRAGHGGTGRVTFRVDERGYVRDLEIQRSTGDGVLDGEIEPALHLAEPFAETPEWISVMVRFER